MAPAKIPVPGADAVRPHSGAKGNPSVGANVSEWVAATRLMVAGLVDFPARWREGVCFIPTSAGGVSAEWVVADGASADRRIVHCHGGGWVAGGVDSSRGRGAALSRLARASVLLLDYRLAPEHLFPAGLDDCDTAFSWAADHGPEGPGRSTQLSLWGDSAGGALATAVCARSIETHKRVPDSLILLSAQLSIAAALERVARDDPMVSQENLWRAYAHYTGNAVPPDDPLVSPLFTPTSTLERFPPTLIQVGSDELLLYDARTFAARLAQARVRCVLSVWPRMPHCWHARLDTLPDAERAIREVAHFICPA